MKFSMQLVEQVIVTCSLSEEKDVKEYFAKYGITLTSSERTVKLKPTDIVYVTLTGYRGVTPPMKRDFLIHMQPRG